MCLGDCFKVITSLAYILTNNSAYCKSYKLVLKSADVTEAGLQESKAFCESIKTWSSSAL